jgi:hypothetical protein
MVGQFWHPVYQEWQYYSNPEIHEYAKKFGLAIDNEIFKKDGIVGTFFSDMSLERTINKLDELDIHISDFYKLNSNRMRCDEFKTKHDGLHVLFSGCSITAGEGLFQEYTWPHIVYSKLMKEHKLSGYFNLSNPGFTIISIIWQLFAYFKKFGNPDMLFLNLPDIDREIRVVNVDNPTDEGLSDEFSGMLYYAYYNELLEYCNKNNIKLYAFTWDYLENPNFTSILDLRKSLKEFHMPSQEERDRYMFEFIENNSNHKHKDLLFFAMDGAHPGIAENSFLAEYAYKIYRSSKSD